AALGFEALHKKIGRLLLVPGIGHWSLSPFSASSRVGIKPRRRSLAQGATQRRLGPQAASAAPSARTPCLRRDSIPARQVDLRFERLARPEPLAIAQEPLRRPRLTGRGRNAREV